MGFGVAHQTPNAVELVISGEDHRFLCDLPNAFIREDALFLDWEVHEAPEDVEQAAPLPHLTPEIGGAIAAIGRRRIAGVALVAKVEGQELGPVPAQARGHEYLVLIHCEMNRKSVVEGKR